MNQKETMWYVYVAVQDWIFLLGNLQTKPPDTKEKYTQKVTLFMIIFKCVRKKQHGL